MKDIMNHFRMVASERSVKMFVRRTMLLILTFTLIFLTAGISLADFEGTVGTRFTITGSDFGTNKPKVYLEYEQRPGMVKRVYARVKNWDDTSITCLWLKPLPAGRYNLWVTPHMKGAVPMSMGTFSIVNPVIHEVTPYAFTPGTTITINGQFFTNKKPKVYIKDMVTQGRKRCRVLASTMDPETGISSLSLVVPKKGSGYGEIYLDNLVGKTSFSLDGLNNWHVRSSGIATTLNGVTYGNGAFVAVGFRLDAPSGGSILTSEDGVTWTERNSGTTSSLYSVAYGNGTFVAVGDGVILTSPDGVVWTQRNSEIYVYRRVTYGNGTFVISLGGNGVFTSTDGITWTYIQVSDPLFSNQANAAISDYVLGFANNIFICKESVDINCRFAQGCDYQASFSLTSSDGIHWVSHEAKIGDPGAVAGDAVAYGNGTFAIAMTGSIGFLISADGITWADESLYTGIPGRLYAVSYGNGTFVAVGVEDTGGIYGIGAIVTSTDGAILTQRNPGVKNQLYGVTYGADTFVAVGLGGVILQSDPI